jgi:dolichyl-phosphate-mannose--protein O-mannosyl transferase
MPAWTRLDTALLTAVTGVAAALRLWGLGSPAELVFDELFYAQNSCLLAAAPQVCGITEPLSNAHPPLGQWLIAAGIAVVGYDPFGWRVASAVVGSATVALTYVLARVVLRGAPPRAAAIGSAIAAGLLAIDVLHLVLSRVAMLDVFLVFFVVAAFLAIALDLSRAPRPGRGGIGQWLFGRPWRLLAGVLIGAAVAVKWSGVYSALGVVLLVVAWEVVARRWDTSGAERSWRRSFVAAFRDEWLPTVVVLGVIPLVVYLVTYLGVAEGSLLALPWREGSWWRDVAGHQVAMARFHAGLEGHHPYESPAWSWWLLKRPVAFFFEDGGTYRHILALGSPIAWWPTLAAFGWLAVSWVRGSRGLGPAVVVIGALSAYLPWLILGFARSQIFVWYVLPALPLIYIGVGVAVTRWHGWARGALGVGLTAALAAAFFFWPVATATPLPSDEWRLRMWFSDCERPGAPTLSLPDDTVNSGPPPDGWCWI